MGVNSYINIGKKIKQLRLEKGLKQKDVAKLLDIPVSTYSNYENGNREPNSEIIEKISKILNTTPEELIELDNKSLKNNKEMIKNSKYRVFIYSETYNFINSQSHIFDKLTQMVLPKSLSNSDITNISKSNSLLITQLTFYSITEQIFEDFRYKFYSESSDKWVADIFFENSDIYFNEEEISLIVSNYSEQIEKCLISILKSNFNAAILYSKECYNIQNSILENALDNFLRSEDTITYLDALEELINKELTSALKYDFLTECYYMLNNIGRNKAIGYILDLSEQPKYTDKE